jgi:Glycosyl hydrolase family 65, N-terminal domain
MFKHAIVLPMEHYLPGRRVAPDRNPVCGTVRRTDRDLLLPRQRLHRVHGSLEEGRPGRAPGTFVNGFHETWPIVHPEEVTALPRTGQAIVSVPDATMLRLYVDDEPLFRPDPRRGNCDLDRWSGFRVREAKPALQPDEAG